MYTKSEFCKKAGITPETLRHYVDIGLLFPKEVTPNGYRKYDRDSILDLWFYRLGASLGNPLKEVKNWQNSMTLEHFHKRLLEQECRLEQEIVQLENRLSMIREICLYTERELKTNQKVSKEPGLDGYRAFCDGGHSAEGKIVQMAELFPMTSIEIDYGIPKNWRALVKEDCSKLLDARLGICIMKERWSLLEMGDTKGLELMPAMDSVCMSLVTTRPFSLRIHDFLPLLCKLEEDDYEPQSDIIGSLFCREVIGNEVHYLLKCRILVK